MAWIDISDLTFSYEGDSEAIFENLTVRLDDSWRLGLLGRNGRGKTTLLRLLLGMPGYTGHIFADTQFDYFPFPVPDPERPGQAVAEDLRPELEDWRLCRELGLLGLGETVLSRPFSTLSPGEQTRFLLALLFGQEGRFLLLDEPTNHLDLEGRQLLGEYLAGKRGFLLASHDRALLDRCTDHILAFLPTGLEVQQGNFSCWWENNARREQFERAEQEKLNREVKRLDQAARRTADWSSQAEGRKKGERISGLRPDRGYLGRKAAKMMKRSKSVQARREAAVEEKSRLLRDAETAPPLKLQPLVHPQRRLIQTRELAADYGGGPVCRGVTFSVEQGERVALQGPNGAGKSSLLKLVMGEDVPRTGTLELASGLVISYVPQDASFLRGSLREFIRSCGADESLFKAVLRKLGFAREQFDRALENCSAGQKKKILLARSLCVPAHLYVWDEPLNYLDIWSRMQLEELLAAAQPTMLLVEHDSVFLQKAAVRVVKLEKA